MTHHSTDLDRKKPFLSGIDILNVIFVVKLPDNLSETNFRNRRQQFVFQYRASVIDSNRGVQALQIYQYFIILMGTY